MTRTHRRVYDWDYHIWRKTTNYREMLKYSYSYSKEKKRYRKPYWNSYRLRCKNNVRKGRELEPFFRTQGWLTN